MKRPHLLGTLCATVFTFLTISANAALVSRLGGLAYYDTETNLTWLTDANVAGPTLNWSDANAWAASLNISGITEWRLPDTMQPDSSCDDQIDGGIFGPQGFRTNCTGSEMDNMFYNVLGGVASSDIADTHNANYDLFSNIISSFYWSGTERADATTSAWTFRFDDGSQRSLNKSVDLIYAWAVHSGDVSVVPIPATAWLFGSGLLGLVGMARRKKA